MCGRCRDCKQLFEPNETAEKETSLRGRKARPDREIMEADSLFLLLSLFVRRIEEVRS